MDKTLLKNFAVYSRNKLMQEIINKASMIGITDKGIKPPLSESNEDMLMFDIKAVETYKIYDKEVEQYKKLIEELEIRTDNDDYDIAFNTLIEEIAYTWFNRLIAIRFMEVNNYLPDKMRVLSSGREGVNEPEFLTNYNDTSLEFNDKELEQLSNFKMDGSNISMEKMFHLLFIKQCNALNANLPELFEKTDDYAELLLTISYNDPDGVLYKLVHDIPEAYFDIKSEDGNGQVEIIGWMYQYYNIERKEKVININKGIIKKEDIPAATQLFTTDWVVRYMVDNSLGKYWLERNPDSVIRDSLKYLMPAEIQTIKDKVSPEELKILDNAMGSGHCLSYAFDVLMMIYESEGYSSKEAAKLILEKNIYGLDIDKRAYQLAYFAMMMKARQYNRNILTGDFKNNLDVFKDSMNIDKAHLEYLGLTMDTNIREKALEQILDLIEKFNNATEIGSILILEEIDETLLLNFVNDVSNKGQIMIEEVNINKTQEELRQLIRLSKLLIQKYDIVVTNPPYLNKFSPKLKKYLNKNYKNYSKDLFSAFIYKNLEICKPKGYSAYMSPFVWMFIMSYEKLREYIIEKKHISSLIQMEYSAFEEATVPICTFVLKNEYANENGNYIKLSNFNGGMEVQKTKTLEAIKNPICGYYYKIKQEQFNLVPGIPIVYWSSKNMMDIFLNGKSISEVAHACVGLQTSDNKRFLRLWHEVSLKKVGLDMSSLEEAKESTKKWFPYNKGGYFRRWYGNQEYLVNWENDGCEIKEYNDFLNSTRSSKIGIGSTNYYFKKHITWGAIGSSKFSVRSNEEGMIVSNAGMAIFTDENTLDYLIAFLNSKVCEQILGLLSPTLNFNQGNINSLPIRIVKKDRVNNISKENISISKIDWDSFETSWEFTTHPFLKKHQIYNKTVDLESSYEDWKRFTNDNFKKIKLNEEEINSLFIETYDLTNELTAEVLDKDVSVTKIFDNKNEIDDGIKGNRYILIKEDTIKSFISYAIGCIFGRYSLELEGLIYTGEEFNNKFKIENGRWKIKKQDFWNDSSIDLSNDNVLLITDDEYFEDDISERFINFVRIVYGNKTLDENLRFIKDALGGGDSPKEVIRNYFLKDFYKDHLKIYQNRPIYWLYDSGKENGLKALIYMHRYNEDTTGKLRIDYLHKMQKTYESKIDDLKYDIANNNNSREVAISEKALTKITKQLKECKDYDEKIAHLALARIPIDLDDGVKVNYDKIQTDENGKNLQILSKI